MKITGLVVGSFLTISGFCPLVPAMAADVDIYAEGAYTSNDLVVYIYADINTDPLVSAVVKFNYDTTKFYPVDAETDPLNFFPVAEKNETVWYFGSSSGTKYAYKEPQIDTEAGEVVFFCGKIAENDPTAGVTGTRSLIGTVKLTRTENTNPTSAPDEYFGISLGLGVESNEGTFANFVTNTGTVLDNTANGISYSVIIRKRGDANADGVITNSDYFAVKNLLTTGIYKVYADCNNDGLISNSDYFCIKSLM